MSKDKPRIQLALYSRPKHPGSYHYALFIAPKNAKEPCTKHHVKNTLQLTESGTLSQPWRYEQTLIQNIETESRLLVRVIIAKSSTKDPENIRKILESIPVHQVEDSGQPGDEPRRFSCSTWVRDAYKELKRVGAVSERSGSWEEVEEKALEYLESKRGEGRWSSDWKGEGGVPLMDLVEGREIFE